MARVNRIAIGKERGDVTSSTTSVLRLKFW